MRDLVSSKTWNAPNPSGIRYLKASTLGHLLFGTLNVVDFVAAKASQNYTDPQLVIFK
jgi:hypothetical protein